MTETIGTLSGGGASGGNIILGDVNTGAGALTVNQLTYAEYAGIISGTGSFTKARNGTLELTGQSTYSGTTTISGGDIIISISSALPSNPLTFTNTANIYIFDSSITQTIGTLSASGVTGAKIDSAGTLTINQNADGIYSGRIIGTGAVVKSGSYILTLNGTNTYQGGTTISEGTLRVSGGNALHNSGSVILADVSGALLDVITSETIGSLSGGGIHGGTTYGNIAVASGATLTVNQTINRIFSGTISGAGAFTKASYGVLTLNSASTYQGTTTVAGGDLVVGITNAIPNTALAFTGTSRLLLITNGVSLEVGSLTETGSTNSKIWLYDSSVLTINQAAAGSFSSVITSNGDGHIVKNGAATLTLSGVNTYLGDTTINLGSIIIAGSGSLGAGTYYYGALNINNLGTFRYVSSVPQYLLGTIIGTAEDPNNKISYYAL